MASSEKHNLSPLRTLRLEILSDNSKSFVVAPPNSNEPIPFETEFFKGHAMLVVRTNPVDPRFQSFFNGKRQFEVQVQGKFKREPIGEIYVGAEASNKLELGILTRSISRAALHFCGTMVNDLHHSFGDSHDQPDYELPHIVAPIFPTMDKILITPDGEPLPPLGVPFNEDLEYRKKRLKYRYIKDAKVNLNTTYSFSVNTANLDLLAWKLVGIPMVRPLDLRTFSGNSSIHLIGYEIPRSAAEKFPNTHPYRCLNYVFCMKLTPVDPDRLPLLDLPSLASDDENLADNVLEDEDLPSDEVTGKTDHRTGNHASGLAREESEDEDDGEEDLQIRDTFSMSQAPNSHNKAPSTDRLSGVTLTGSGKVSMTGWLRKKFRREKQKKDVGAAEDHDLGPVDLKDSSDYVDVDYEMEAIGDLQYCPICIELNDHKRDGRRRIYYLLTIHDSIKSSEAHSSANHDHIPIRFKTYSEIAKSILLVPMPKIPKVKKLSPLEQRRRQVVESYRLALANSASKPHEFGQLKAFLLPITEVENTFLGGNITLYEKFDKNNEILSWEGHVAMAQSRRHFVEQYLIVTRQEVIVRRSIESKRNLVTIKCDKIVSVQSLPHDYCPIADFSILQIETFTRVYYFLLRSNLQVNQWLEVFITILGNKCMNSPYRMIDFADKSHINHQNHSSVSTLEGPASSEENKSLIRGEPNASPTRNQNHYNQTVGKAEFFDPTEDQAVYYERPACWKADKRRIYNYRRIFFTNTVGEKYSKISPNDLMISILKTAFFLTESEGSASEYDWVKFWDEISLLQCIDLRRLTETEKTAFFLNLYHVMVLHGTLVFGPPSTSIWNAFFSNICYLVSFESVSISEIEYCILRAAMAKSPIFTGIVIASPPQSIFPSLALTHRDFRLHFAINCGSLSLIEKVPVYSSDQLDDQLDEVTRQSIDNFVEIDLNKKSVAIPKLPFQDYSIDAVLAAAVSARNDLPARTVDPSTQSEASSATVGAHQAVSSNSTSSYTHHNAIECLRAILPYLPKPKRQFLQQLLVQDAHHINIKFRSMNFKCRTLKKA